MATRNIVPRADNEGQLGTASKRWADTKTVLINGGTAPLGNAQVVTSSDITTTSNTVQSITGFSFSIAANETWAVEAYLLMTGITGGTKFAINGPAACTPMLIATGTTSGVTAFATYTATALATLTGTAHVTSNGTTGMNVSLYASMINSSTAGTVQLQFASGTNGNTSTIKAGSYMVARRVS